MADKTEAQIKNEEEVRRIMEERGYSPASNKKQIRRTLGRNFSFKPLVVGLFAVGILIGGWLLWQNNLSGSENDNSLNEITAAKTSDELAEFQNCLSLVDTSEIAVGDSDFWNKHISRYEQMISCYDKYPTVADSSEKAELENRLAEVRESSESADANNAEYQANMARIDAEEAQKLAEIKANYEHNQVELDAQHAAKMEEYEKQRTQYAAEQAAYEAKQAECNAFKSEYLDVDTYKSKNGLDVLYSNWQTAKNAYYSAVDSQNTYISKYGSEISERERTSMANSLAQKKAEMDAAHNTWSSRNTALSNEYNTKYREACL